VLEALLEVDVNVDVVCGMGAVLASAVTISHNASSDQGAEGRVQGLPPTLIGEGQLRACPPFPLADRIAEEAKMESDDGGEEDDGAEAVVLLGDQFNRQQLHGRWIVSQQLSNPQETSEGRQKQIRALRQILGQKSVCSRGGGGKSGGT
jgi:hypothetical protein